MNELEHTNAATETIVRRTRERYERYRQRTLTDTDHLFVRILLGQWAVAVVVALVVSPYAWTGSERGVHAHVWLALLLGGAIASGPLVLARMRPGEAVTRHVIACAQMLFSALFIHLSGGRIETHFHVFCSLALLSFYLDWRVLVTAAGVIAIEHAVRGLVWPESVYGIVNPEWWRFAEHASWVLVSVAFLGTSCVRRLKEWLVAAEEGGLMEAMAEGEWRRQSVLARDKRETADHAIDGSQGGTVSAETSAPSIAAAPDAED